MERKGMTIDREAMRLGLVENAPDRLRQRRVLSQVSFFCGRWLKALGEAFPCGFREATLAEVEDFLRAEETEG